MFTVYVVIFFLAIAGPASFGLVVLAGLGARGVWHSGWSTELWSKGWYRFADAVRNPLTTTHGYRHLDGSPWRWHVVAALLALTPLVAGGVFVLAGAVSQGAEPESSNGAWQAAMVQVYFTVLFVSTPFALVYLSRLYRGRVPGAELYALAAWMAPRLIALAAFNQQFLEAGFAHFAVVILAPVAALAMLGGLAWRGSRAARIIAYLSAAVAVFALGWMTVAPLVFVDALLSAMFLGFGIFVIRDRESHFVRNLAVFLRRHTNVRVTGQPGAPRDALGKRGRLRLLAYAALGALMAAIGYRLSASELIAAGPEFGAALATGIAALFGLGTWQQLRRRGVEDVKAASSGVIVAAVALLAAASQHLGTAFPSEEGGDIAQVSRIGFGIAIALAVSLLVLAVVRPRLDAYRPMLLAFAWPSAVLLGNSGPITELNEGWLATSVAGMITVAALWAMWHGTAPPRLTTTLVDAPIRYPVAVARPPAPTPTPEPATPPTVAVPALRRA